MKLIFGGNRFSQICKTAENILTFSAVFLNKYLKKTVCGDIIIIIIFLKNEELAMLKTLKFIGIVISVAAVIVGAYLLCKKVMEYTGRDNECGC